jgi:16S rRNA (uracil1498-N3)-methyltransferase
MVERGDHEGVATFVATESDLAVGATIALGEDAAHHLRVRRLAAGARIAITDGHGKRGEGALVRLARTSAHVELESMEEIAPLPQVHLLVPIADRDRMLWLAEKATELGVTSWRPVRWRRSRSVSPRGDGPAFARKARARVVAALSQSGGAWLPVIYPDSVPERAIAAAPEGVRLVFDPRTAERVDASPMVAPVTLAVGPEGGFDGDELALLQDGGFRAVSFPTGVLRFETAAIAALTLARTACATSHPAVEDA